jgi:hypothetical protein
VDPERPDLGRFPALARAKAASCLLEPGDLLFLPPYHWHHVRSLDVSISVSFWSPPWLDHFLTPAGRRTIRLLFERDRLIALRGRVQGGGGFLDMARFFTRREEPELAVLFAAAALEERLRALVRNAHVGAREIHDLRDATSLVAALVERGACSAEENRKIGEWVEITSSARSGREVSLAEASAMIEGVDAFAARHPAVTQKRTTVET